ncbi:hypothetical protein Acr_00g0063980 [Actinidia rufa]|uniref:Uncharacterized protein n=1 Tax=Actinidia rufa TaxID=165716 RepID=A0A7J0DPX5_9ERIC|nr:hypothetical protein Acr_00g0063980 [Actinidia rufa]
MKIEPKNQAQARAQQAKPAMVIGAHFRRASEEEAPIRGSWGDPPPPCAIPATKILNTSPLPSLYEAFAIIDEDERRRRLIQAPPAIFIGPTPIAYQMAFAASGSGPRSSSGSLLQQQPSSSTANMATSTPTAFHGKTSYPTCVLDSEANDHMTGTPSFLGSDAGTILANLDGLSRHISLFESPPV